MMPDNEKYQSHSILTKAISDYKESIVKNIKSAAEIVKDLTILWSLSSILLGAFFVGSYLKQFEVPFIPLDNTLLVVFQVFLFVFMTLSVFTTVYVILPVTLKFFVSYETTEVFPNLFMSQEKRIKVGEASAKLSLRGFLVDYGLFYFPLITLEILFAAFLKFSFDPLIAGIFLVVSFVGGCAFVTCAARPKSVFLFLFSDTVYWFLVANFSTFAWLLTISALSERVAESSVSRAENSDVQKVIGSLIVMGVSVLHIVLSRVDSGKAKRVPLVVFFIILGVGCYWLGPAYIGGAILRVAGLGGGTTINYRVDSGLPAKGCLVWPSSSYLIIMDQSDTGSCLRSPRVPFSGETQSATPPVHMLRRESIQIL